MDDLICVTHILNWCNAPFHISVSVWRHIHLPQQASSAHLERIYPTMRSHDTALWHHLISHCYRGNLYFSFQLQCSVEIIHSRTHYKHNSCSLIISSLIQLFLWCCCVKVMCPPHTHTHTPTAHPTPVCCCLTSTGMTQLRSCCPSSAQSGSCPFPTLAKTSAAACGRGKHKLTA